MLNKPFYIIKLTQHKKQLVWKNIKCLYSLLKIVILNNLTLSLDFIHQAKPLKKVQTFYNQAYKKDFL